MRRPPGHRVALCGAVLALSLTSACSSQPRAATSTQAVQAAPSAPLGTDATAVSVAGVACNVTQPNGSTPPGERPSPSHYGNGRLWTALWTDGTVVFRPGGPGWLEPGDALGMKWPWWRAGSGPFSVTGRRLDGNAGPLTAVIPDGYGASGFQASGLIFPTEGCWEVTARVGADSLTLVTRVVRTN